MQDQSFDIWSRLIFVAVCLVFICGGAVLIYSDYRLGSEREQLDASGIETVAMITSHELLSSSSASGSGVTWDYVTQFSFTPASGDLQTGETWSHRDTEIWFQGPPPNEWVLASNLAVGDRILVTYLPEDPGIHRTITDCTGCVDLGAFGDNIRLYIGGFIILLGAAILFRIRRSLMAPL